MKFNDDENKFVFSYDFNIKSFDIFDKYQDYLSYKRNPLIFENNDKLLEMSVISLLDSLGFSTSEVGTFLYGELIVKIYNMIKIIQSTKELWRCNFNRNDFYKKINDFELWLINSLNDLDSHFYISLTNDEMTLYTFHNYIIKAIPNKYKKSGLFCDDNVESINYGYLAYKIASYIISNLNEQFCINDNSVEIPNNEKKYLKLYL